jgi:hypothetical protein
VPISEEFLPSVDPTTGAAIAPETGEDEGVQRIDEHHEIRLDSTFHDELDIHEGEEIDPRLAGLAALLRNGERKA